jgi:DNA-binding MarR family transcriptional regulator
VSAANLRTRDALRVLARLSRILESADSGVTVPQYRMLCALSEGGERSARLARRLAIRKPTATALADGLVAAGYATRAGDAEDRRVVMLELTPSGVEAMERADAAYAVALAPLLGKLKDPDGFLDNLLTIGLAMDESLRVAR